MKHSKPRPAEGRSLDTRQIGALCWRMHRGKVEVLLVTSRDTGRWVIPKGWPMADRPDPDAAAQEAWEEAGVKGDLDPQVLATFDYDKILKPGLALPCTVAVYPLRVGLMVEKFPERKERRRKWFAAEKAARKVAEPSLREILSHLAEEGGALCVQPPADGAAGDGGTGALAGA
ncbi:MAG: hypothetical protein RIR62_2991 [Pseudomonadota bacterium]|jgi:8-oxo-dGTP pyrophosphatase MutT (NUDIX family)